jgi:geranylgeranyl diphosphate synthase, type II
VRPRLCLAAAAGAGADPRLALPAAAAVEMIHAFSLVHDDLPALDDDSERRGQPTSHVRYGEAVAVLVGDALLSAAYRHVAEHLDVPADVRLAVIAELAAGVEGMIDGQYLDVTASTPPTHDQLAELHRLKTGSLIGASVTTGALVGGIDRDQLGPHRAYASELGLLFQIVDDILDDGSHDEPSYVNTLGIDRARALARESHHRALALLEDLPGDTTELRDLTDLIALRTA